MNRNKFIVKRVIPMDRKTIIAQRLIELRELQKLDKEKVAEAVDVAYSTYANYESANREPSTEILLRLAQFHKVTLDYIVGNDPNYESDEGRGVLTEVIKDIKQMWTVRSRNIKVNEEIYQAVAKDVGRPDPERINSKIHMIVSKYYQSIEEERQLKLRNAEKAEALAPYYDYLARHLEATKQSGTIEIGLTNERVGHEGSQDIYKLVDYEIAMEYQSIKLVLERKGELWPIRFENINDIKFLNTSTSKETHGRMKAWIYMDKTSTWRMFLNFENHNVPLV